MTVLGFMHLINTPKPHLVFKSLKCRAEVNKLNSSKDSKYFRLCELVFATRIISAVVMRKAATDKT